jgi:hypothetical protein
LLGINESGFFMPVLSERDEEIRSYLPAI